MMRIAGVMSPPGCLAPYDPAPLGWRIDCKRPVVNLFDAMRDREPTAIESMSAKVRWLSAGALANLPTRQNVDRDKATCRPHVYAARGLLNRCK